MPHYSPERKEAILQKMAPPHSLTVAELAGQEGISTATLYNWRKAARERGAVLPSNSATPEKWSSEEKFRIVLETAPMTEAELGEYCRKHGLYPEQIEAWKTACMGANAQSDEQARRNRKAATTEKKRVKKLESELRRKEKALAETAALLTLSKKAEAIWGPKDEDE
ncbi:Transposase [Marinobacter segnicrescens]|jgi:transposase-like protein|uniref:Transposase n=1 Tax=Marinobacter segnicrescens TaxID=430453 RepID=A0A1I0GXE8_9GAMM|nr:Transposase [Marinobacter segnicrescens]SET89139.1 Transposase [Marinobacter segnicrescens]|tara:strand:+ start:59 stop:559 length:501 start_codon:yes stop_codon:yes gene_type:complete